MAQAPRQSVCIWLGDNGVPGIYYKQITTIGSQKFYQYMAVAGDRSEHPVFPSPFSSGMLSGDGSGFLCAGCNSTNVLTSRTLYTRAGVYNAAPQAVPTGNGYYGWLGTATIEDPNGNTETTTDTIGRAFGTSASTSDFTGCSGDRTTTSASILSVPGYNGSTAQIKTCFAALPITTKFSDSHYYDPAGNTSPWNSGPIVLEAGGTKTVVQAVLQFDGNLWTTSPRWVFQYKDSLDGSNYGDLTQITLPTGGTIQYTYATVNPCDAGYPGVTNMSRGVIQRTMSAGDGSPAVTTTYSSGVVNDGTNDTVHTFTGLGGGCSLYETLTQYYNGSGSGRSLIKTVKTDYTYSSDPYTSYYGDTIPHVISVLPTRTTTTLPNNLVSKVERDFQTATASGGYVLTTGKVVQERVYDWGTNAPGALDRCTSTTYKTQQNSSYFSSDLLDLPAVVSVYSGACGTGTLMAQTTNGYDEYSLASSGVTVQRDSGASGRTVRGNLTSAKRWLNTTGSTLNDTYTHYDTGEKYQYTDPKSNVTTYSYDPTGGYLIQTQMPTTGSIAHVVSATYDVNSGLITSTTGQNGTPSTATFTYDQLFRLTNASYPDTGCTQLSYPSLTSVVKTVCLTATLSQQTTYNFDGLGRAVGTILSEGSGVNTYTRTAYNAQNQVSQVWNPSRCDPRSVSSCPGETTWGSMQYQYDGLGRMTLLIPQDGSQSTNNETYTYSSNTTTFKDESGSQWARTTDGLGRLVQVLEPNGSPQPPPLETDYTYDVLGNLTCVEQHGGVTGTGCSSAPSNDASSPWKVRRFSYDSLSRLLTAKNAETGTNTYTYSTSSSQCAGDAKAPCTRTDARGIQTTYAYDALNRLTSKSYSNGETTVANTYDASGSGNYGIGLRTGMTDASGSTTWTYEKMGRVTGESRTIGGIQKTISTSYNRDGSVGTLTYPSGAVLNYTIDTTGRVVSLHDDTNNIQYAYCASYAPPGELASLVLNAASCSGLKETDQYNSRLQPGVLSAAAGVNTVLSLSYDYHSGTANNGNIYTILNVKDSTRTQTFTYDTLNRILTAREGSLWGISFTNSGNGQPGIDAWGNLIQTSPIAGTAAFPMSVNQQVSVSQNQFTLNGYSYDPAGNVLTDGLSSGCSGSGYTWNAEELASCTNGTTYTYNGDGERVKKSSGTLYWGGQSGGALIESDLSGNLTSEYIFFNGRRIARRDLSPLTVYYYFSDHLGSSSVITDAAGSIKNESDYYPFGGESSIVNTVPNHYKFTGKERDAESGNDYFGARYYASSMGRFMSPDWSAKEEPVPYAKLDDPQSLNLYAYVLNNPLTSEDPDGHDGDGPVKMTPAEAQQATAMAYSEDTQGGVDEDEAIVSTAVNRVNSGDKSYSDGDDLNLTNVINAPHQYQGVGGVNYNAALAGTANTANATAAVQAVQKNGVTTDATIPWTKVDKNGKVIPPSAKTLKKLALNGAVPAKPAQVGNTLLYKPGPPKPKPQPKPKPKPQPKPLPKQQN